MGKDPRVVGVLKVSGVDELSIRELELAGVLGVLNSASADRISVCKITATWDGRPVALLVVTDK